MKSEPNNAESQILPFIPPTTFLLTTEGELYGEDSPGNRELVRRIHACFQACDGISTEELEQGVVAEMRQTIVALLPILRERVQEHVPPSEPVRKAA